MSNMAVAPSRPGHVIQCVVWTEYPPAVEGHELWLAGCTCGSWSRKGHGTFVNQEWEGHLKEAGR